VGPHHDMARIAKQRRRTCLIAEADRVPPQIGPGQFDAFTRIHEQAGYPGGRILHASLIGTAEEEHASLARSLWRDRCEILLGGFHLGSGIRAGPPRPYASGWQGW